MSPTLTAAVLSILPAMLWAAPEAPESVAPPHATAQPPERVQGDESIQAEYDDKGAWRYEDMAIPTPLPVGYPAPTPPGVLEIKHYPSVRRAEVSGQTDSRSANMQGFWPLFQHISRNEIAMTSPVEMEYAGDPAANPAAAPAEGEEARPAWTMAFLYYQEDLGPTGADPADPRVTVRDTEPVTVLAMGLKGYWYAEKNEAIEKPLTDWLAANPQWRRAGEPRWFGYNGPEMPANRRWAEIQIPIVKVESDAAADSQHE